MFNEKLLYESFNARYLNYEEIANLFVTNKQYSDLIMNNHSLLMGPRGSGKTTLLKMLTIPAQHYWQRDENQNIESPSFFSIYIPTDIQWKKQVDDFEKEFSDNPSYKDLVTKLIVTTNVLISLCDTFSNILEFKTPHENDLINEAELCTQLINDWKISKPASTNLASVKHALLNRLKDINSHIKKVRTLKLNEEQIEYPDYYYDEYLMLVVIGCNAFENIFKHDPFFKSRSFKWALCFDELEIAPTWLQTELLALLRSTPYQNIFFKLTMVPLVLLDDQIQGIHAREDQDFKVIRTWTYSKDSLDDWQDFSRRLIQDKFRRRYYGKVNPLGLFGKDSLDLNIARTFRNEPDFSEKSGYTEGSLIWRLFKELASFDMSFRKFLTLKKINPNNPVPFEKTQEDEIFRKIKPIALYRYQFRSQSNIGKKRSRKNPALYYGIPFLYHLCDGNPRTLIGVIDEFLRILQTNKQQIERFHISVQSRLVYNNSRKYLEGIYNHPDSNVQYLNKYINLGKFLEKIGDYFRYKLIDDDFKMDPSNCFIVDRDVPSQIVELLKVAMHLGAIIYLDPKETFSKNGLIGKRFRLSYFLFPHFQLPIVEYNEVQLSTILRKGTDKIDQLLLFDPK